MALTPVDAMVTVQWLDNAENETGFRVERSTDGAEFLPVATLPCDATSYEDRDVAAGSRYWYRIAAFNAGGDSDFSPTVTGIAPGLNSAPTISALIDRTVLLGQSPGVMAFSVGDTETASENLVVIGNTSNPSLVPRENVRFGGSGSSRTLTVTPVADVTGWTTIWVKVSDGELTAVSSFVLVVAAPSEPEAPIGLSVSAHGDEWLLPIR